MECFTLVRKLDTYKFTDMTVITQHIDPLTCIVAQFNSKKHMVNERKYGKPHQEFVKILCTYKDIFELRKRVEAFDLQYEMHASSYQRDCLRNWMLDSASGYFYNQTNGLHYEVLDSITMKHTMQLKKTWQEATKRSVPRMAGSTLWSKSSVARYLFIACLQASSRRMSF
ncbi:hypothetical protein YC2023_120921 [Brassica napus]